MIGGRNGFTSSEGTSEVVERHSVVCSLAYLVETERTEKLVEENGCPSPQLLKFMWEILWEVSNGHGREEAHGHLCPGNIFICKNGQHFYAKLGPDRPCVNCSKIESDASSWQAPERTKNQGSPTLSANIYSLGAIFYYCITGEHLKSKEYWKTVKKKGKTEPKPVACRVANDLISRSLEKNPGSRPKAIELLNRFIFWTSEKRVSFLRETSEKARDSECADLWNKLQKLSVCKVIDGERDDISTWDKKIDKENVTRNILEQKKREPEEEKTHEPNKKSKQKKNTDPKQDKKEACMYNFKSVRDLVRLIRNMKAHYGELPKDVQETVGTLYDDFYSFFTSRFPNLLIEVYKVVRECCKKDKNCPEYCRKDKCCWECCKKDKYFCRFFSGEERYQCISGCKCS